MKAELEKWAKEQWDESALGDSRRNKRAVKIAANLINKPDLSLPQQLESWKDLKAAYRFFNNEEISHEALQKKHRENLLKKAEQETPVLFIQDTSQLDYSGRPAIKGLGFIGNGNFGKGILIHSTLAVSFKNGSPNILGLANQHVWIREIIQPIETRKQAKNRPRESFLWKETLEKIKKPSHLKSQWISIGDRANDVFDFLLFCQNKQWDYLIRANQDRTIIMNNGEKSYLKKWARSLISNATKKINLRGRNGLPSREINLKVSWGKTNILHPKNYGKKYENIQVEAWCIRCWEDAPNGIEWILLSNIPIDNSASALEKIDWYTARWLIEEYHKCLKTGCAIEKRQLRTSEGLLKILGFLGIVATKLLSLKFVARQQPHDLAKDHITSINLQVICAHFKLNKDTITLREYWHKVANLGGFIGRKSDGEPGWQTLWQGLLRLLDMVSGACLFKNCG